MKKLLHVVASPRGGKSRTLRVARAFLERFRERHPDWLVDEINVFEEELPSMSARQVDGKYILLGNRDYRKGASALRGAACRSLYQQDARCFARGIVTPGEGGEPVVDRVVDASICGSYLFGLLPPDDPRVAETVQRVREKLWCATSVGGLARYENDA